MNRISMMTLIALALTAAGCAKEQPYRGRPADLRMHAENAAGYSFLDLTIKDLTVSSGGRALEADFVPLDRRLLDPTNSPLLATLYVPDDVQDFTVDVTLDDYGSFEAGGVGGYVTVRGPPIHFAVPSSALFVHDHVVLHLDVDRSLVATARSDERLLLPNLNVRY